MIPTLNNTKKKFFDLTGLEPASVAENKQWPWNFVNFTRSCIGTNGY